jgi:hypothetical protein
VIGAQCELRSKLRNVRRSGQAAINRVIPSKKCNQESKYAQHRIATNNVGKFVSGADGDRNH